MDPSRLSIPALELALRRKDLDGPPETLQNVDGIVRTAINLVGAVQLSGSPTLAGSDPKVFARSGQLHDRRRCTVDHPQATVRELRHASHRREPAETLGLPEGPDLRDRKPIGSRDFPRTLGAERSTLPEKQEREPCE